MQAIDDSTDRVEFAYYALVQALELRGIPSDDLLIEMVKGYANYYARHQLERIASDAQRNAEYGVARQALARIAALGGE